MLFVRSDYALTSVLKSRETNLNKRTELLDLNCMLFVLRLFENPACLT